MRFLGQLFSQILQLLFNVKMWLGVSCDQVGLITFDEFVLFISEIILNLKLVGSFS